MMFDTKKPFLTTKSVQTRILPEIVKGMLDSIMDMKRVIPQVDYLQVLTLRQKEQ